MLRVTVSTSAAHAKAYFSEGMAQADYYTQDGAREVTGHWHGKGAALLGLRGEVTKEAYENLCDNRHPTTGDQLTPRMKVNRRVGNDLTFSLTKDASLLARYDARIQPAFVQATKSVLDDMEQEFQTRVRTDGRDENRITGNMIVAMFPHGTTRPVDGEPDPHEHLHCMVFNATHDPEEGRWKAGQFHDLHINRPLWEAVFQARMARAMQDLGYNTEREGKAWKVAGLDRETVAKFSRRTALIEAEAKARGITDATAKAELGKKTREKKHDRLTVAALDQAWDARLTPAERETIARLVTRAQDTAAAGGSTQERITAREAMAHAVAHHFTRQSVIEDRTLRETALRYGAGDVTPEDAARELQNPAHGLRLRQVGKATMATTAEVLAEEQAMLAFAARGREACRPLGGYGYPAYHAPHLTHDQEAAARYLLHSPSRVMIVNGAPGVGKTTLMQAIVPVLETRSHQRFHFFAPSASASRGTLREAGFHHANTVASLLMHDMAQRQVRDGVLWIDEAGQLSVKDMHRLFQVAEAQNARVILSGDVRQHGAVERGDAMRTLMEYAVPGVHLEDIVRQQGVYRDAVRAIHQGRVTEGYDGLDRQGWVVQIPDAQARYKIIAEDYAWFTRAGASTLVVAPTHAEGRAVAEAVRQELKREGRLGRGAAKNARSVAVEDRTVFTLRNLHWTDAQKTDAAQYAAGQVVQFRQHAPGIGNGSRWRIERVAGREVHVRDAAGQARVLPLDLAARFEVYSPDTLSLTVGERLRITRQGATPDGHKLENGSFHTVTGFTREGDIVLEHGRVLPQDYAHLASAYYATSHAAQSLTVDRVLLAQSAASLPAASQEQFLVSVSRGRTQARIYTDDKDALREAVTRSGARQSATALLEDDPQRLEPLIQHKRARAKQRRQRERTAAQMRAAAAAQTPQTALTPERERPRQKVATYGYER